MNLEIISIIICCTWSANLLAQNSYHENLPEAYLFNEGQQLLKLDTQNAINYHYNDGKRANIKLIRKKSKIVLLRQFFPESNNIQFEYINIGQDSFLFTEYVNGLNQTITSNGIYHFNRAKHIIDSILIVNPDTYEVDSVYNIKIFKNKSKTGYWIERGEIDRFGHYKNDTRVGNWYFRDEKNFSHTKNKYVNGQIASSTELNLAKQPFDSTTIKNFLVDKPLRISYEEPYLTIDIYSAAKKIRLNNDGTGIIYGHHSHKEVKWSFEQQDEVLIFNGLRFKLIWFMDDYIQFKIISE